VDLILDLLQTASKWFSIPLPSWIFLLHLPVAATMIRVMVPRLYYTKQMAALSWTSLFSYLGSAILAVPLFFRDEISGLPIAHFYDGYLGLVEVMYAAIYIAFFIPFFGLFALKKRWTELGVDNGGSQYAKHRLISVTQNGNRRRGFGARS